MSKEISLLDDTLIRLAASGKSGEEMERVTGVPAAQAVQHVKGLMAKRDVWTEVEQRQLLLHELMGLKDSLMDAATNFRDLDSARLLLKVLQEVGKRLDAQSSQLSADVLRLTEFQQGVLLKAMDAALSFAKGELAERYPDVPVGELDVLVTEGLVRARFELEASDA